MPELEWSVESVSEPKVVAKLVTRADDEETDRTIQNHTEPYRTILLRSHWEAYQVWADGEMVYDSTETDNGTIRLIHVLARDEIKVESLNADETALKSIQKSKLYMGDTLGVYMFLIRKNLHVAVFAVVALLLGIVSLVIGFYMRSVWRKDMCDALLSLGVFILLVGIWIVTDSSLLLVFTQRTGLVELLSYVSFFSFPIALLEFTSFMLTDYDRQFRTMQNIFLCMLVLYCANAIWKPLPIIAVIGLEHTLMGITIVLVLNGCIRSMRGQENRKLLSVMVGYIAFSVCSIFALVFFYIGDRSGYSVAYMLGVVAFVFFLSYAACIAAYEQIREKASLEVYTQMAFMDMMTELGNRAAFLEEKKRIGEKTGAFAYIMIDANNLKTINDTLGHHKGDELLIELARCIRAGVDGRGHCYRISGDEFVVSLTDTTEEETRSCMQAIRDEVAVADRQSDITISAALGYAWTDAEEKDADALLEQADTEMYDEEMKMKRENG